MINDTDISKSLGSALAEAVSVMTAVLRTAIDKTPEDGVNVIADYFAECGCESPEQVALLKLWRERKAEAAQ